MSSTSNRTNVNDNKYKMEEETTRGKLFQFAVASVGKLASFIFYEWNRVGSR